MLWRLSRGGGVQTVVRMLIASADPSAVRFTLVTARPACAEDDVGALPVDVEALGHAGSTLRLRDRIALMIGVARALRRRRPDVAQFHSGTIWLGFLAPLALRGVRWVVEVHDAPGSGRHGAATDRLEGWWARLTRADVVCHSSSVANALRERWHVSPARLSCVPLAVDLEQYTLVPGQRQAVRAGLGLSESAVVLVGVGRVVASKRFDRAVEALAACSAVRPVVLLLVGDGPERGRVLALADRLGVAGRVVAPGAKYGRELAELIGAGDVLLSTSDYEGFGLTLVEGMAAGLPVVATAVGGVTDIVVDGETGFLVAPGDGDALVVVLERLCGDADLRDRMGRAGRLRAEARYSSAELGQAFTEVYERLAGR